MFVVACLLLLASAPEPTALHDDGTEPDAVPDALPASLPAALPDALPDADPLDDHTPRMTPVVDVRLRGGAAGAVRPAAFAGVRARVGVDAAAGGLRADVDVVVATDASALGQAPALLVPSPALPMLGVARLDVGIDAGGAPWRLSLGRMRVDLADGRYVGSEPFDARGRTLDGALARLDGAMPLRVHVGTFVLPTTTNATLSGLAFASLADRDDVDGVFVLAHHDDEARIFHVTSGARARGVIGLATWAIGLDVQLHLHEDAGFAWKGAAAHVEGSTRIDVADLVPALFVEAACEASGPFAQLGDGGGLVLPAPTRHARLGVLDLVDTNDTLVPSLAIGVHGADSDVRLVWRRIVRAHDTSLVELDAIARVQLMPTLTLDAEAGLAQRDGVGGDVLGGRIIAALTTEFGAPH